MIEAWPDEKNVFARFFEKNVSLEYLPQHLKPDVKIISLKQVHSGDVVIIDSANIKRPPEGDALVTTLDGVALTVHTADCLPLLGFAGNVIGACHAGWKGLTQKIIEGWITQMAKAGAKKESLKIAIGPSIGPCHFEVGAEIAQKLVDGVPEKLQKTIRLPHKNSEKNYVSLRELARFKLMTSGILPQNITISQECTYCHPDRFHSYRRDSAKNGQRLEALIVKAHH
jgi:YfiH family protein